MKVAIIGTGYVGLVTGVCFANSDINIICVDNNKDKIKRLNNGECIIYEPGLNELLEKAIKNNKIVFTSDIKFAIEEADIVFSAVGTPPNEDGSADLRNVLAVAESFGKYQNNYKVFVTKSTVPIGTAEKVKNVIRDEHLKRFTSVRDFDVCSNPEFLKEGKAIEDVLNPDRVVIGTASEKAKNLMKQLYTQMYKNKNVNILYTDIKSAEMIKYAANAMLATRISFINDISRLCEKTGANVDTVAKGIGLDKRIGPAFLKAGCGYGGSCFPKDVKALIKTGEENNVNMIIAKAAEESNEIQKNTLFEKLYTNLFSSQNEISFVGKTIAILGCAFKPDTDDMRESPAINLINQLLGHNANIKVHDPIALNNCKSIFGENNLIKYCDDIIECCTNIDAIVLVTDWNIYKTIDWNYIRNINNSHIENPVFIDGRNLLDLKNMQNDWKYICIGK